MHHQCTPVVLVMVVFIGEIFQSHQTEMHNAFHAGNEDIPSSQVYDVGIRMKVRWVVKVMDDYIHHHMFHAGRSKRRTYHMSHMQESNTSGSMRTTPME